MGFAPSYFVLAAILFVIGVSVAAFHALVPTMIAEVSRQKVNLGMGLFMTGGELARTLGPLLAVWAISTWTLDGFFRIVVLDWAASLVLYIRLVFLNVHSWTQAVAFRIMDFTSPSTAPDLMDTVQEHLPNNHAAGDGLYMSVNLLMQLVTTLSVGLFDDNFGLRADRFSEGHLAGTFKSGYTTPILKRMAEIHDSKVGE